MVSGPDTGYLWLLSRTPTMDEDKVHDLLAVARQKGFDTDQLIFVDQVEN